MKKAIDKRFIIVTLIGITIGSLSIGYARTGQATGTCNTNTDILERAYPVNSIFLSTSLSTVSQVHDALGGTWEVYGEGRTLIGVGEGTDANNSSITYRANSTGGVYTVDLSHKHTVNSHSHTMAHTHTVNSHSHTMAHTHTVNSHSHTMAHTHGTSSMSAAIGAPTQNATGIGYIAVNAAGGDSSYAIYSPTWEKGGGRSHNTKIVGNTDGSSTANTTGTSLTTNGSSQANTGGTSLTTNGSSQANTGTASPGTNTKLSSTQSIVQPYIVVYMYKRIS